jgi:hypothetical protein
MKPYPVTYACPHCKQRLQSPSTDASKTVSCCFCQKSFVTPQAPPRPLGGWLTFYGVVMVLVTTFAFVSVVFIPFGILAIFALYGFFKQRRWFVPLTIISNMIGIVLGLYFAPATAAVSLIVAVYFWRSKRVKETFTT